MMWHLFLFLPLLLCTIAIKVPNNNNEEKTKPFSTIEPDTDYGTSSPINYQDDELVDSYLTTPEPSTSEELLPSGLEAPATYLLPPSSDKADYYYAPIEPGSQSDWYPIAHTRPIKEHEQPQESFPIYESDDQSVVTKKVRKPSQRLEAPFETPDFAIVAPSQQQQLPVEEIKKPFSVSIPIYPLQRLAKANRKLNPAIYTKVIPSNLKFAGVDPTIALHLTPPKLQLVKYKNPTKLYPKKYSGGFKPIPIPIAQFADEQLEVPTAKPLKVFMPAGSSESEYLLPIDQKKLYNYQQLEQKRKLKENEEAQQQVSAPANVEDTYEGSSSEQQTLETKQRYPRVYSNVGNVYSAPLQQAPSVAPQSDAVAAAPPPGERTEFRMHGMKGPHSYQFGYDTGKGKNRQFRYEERDNDGHVRGHYGYMDKRGKLRVVNYDAHPEHGFHADAPVEKDDH